MHCVKAADRKRLVRGDVVKVRIEVTAAAGRTWVIVNDPVPPGATIVSNLGGQSEMLADQADGSGRQPSYVERRKDSWRGYFAWMPAGTPAVEYVVRLNGSGRFPDRKSSVEGKRVSVRVALVGRRIIKKKDQPIHNREAI